MTHYRYISIEGNIGAGKTTLACALAGRWGSKLILEQFEDNPFLGEFYREPDKYAFALEMSFLAERYQQLHRDLTQMDIFSNGILSDYAPFKSLLFAEHTLEAAEFKVYRKMHQLLFKSIPDPELILYLHVPIEGLMSNILKRGRPFEREIQSDYLYKVERSYFDFFRSRPDLTVLLIELKSLNFIDDEGFIENIEQLIGWNRSPGTHVIRSEELQ